MKLTVQKAAPWHTSQWFNSRQSLDLSQLSGRVVVLYAFQMLCPGCVTHSLPQASMIHEQFKEANLSVIGLHTVFEHHDVMTPEALAAFIHEYRLSFPIAIDQSAPFNPVPLTMQAYAMRGTPTVILFDQQGKKRLQYFGRLNDLQLGCLIGQLLVEANNDIKSNSGQHQVIGRDDNNHCHDGVCKIK